MERAAGRECERCPDRTRRSPLVAVDGPGRSRSSGRRTGAAVSGLRVERVVNYFGSQRSLATPPLRRSPPVGPLASGGQVLERRGDRLHIGARAAPEAELPELLCRLVVAVNHLVDVVDVKLSGAVPLDRLRDVLDQPGELRLVVGGNERSATRRLSFDASLRSAATAAG